MQITVEEWLQEEGMSLDEALEEYGQDSVMPAMCSEGCEVEPDGRCEHGGESLFLACDLI
jgi:hypothetical protein